jgi:hypothetical protein
MRRALFALLLLPPLWGCAPPRVSLPTGAGSTFPGFAAAYAEAVSGCSGVRTLTAALALSGRAGGTKLRGRVDAGFSAPSSLRLEGVAPFGKPVFVLVAEGARATLLLPRDDRVLRDAPPEDIIEALAGVALDAVRLRAVVSGCGLASGSPSDGREYPKGWLAVDHDGTTTYLKKITGAWRVVASQNGPLTVEYGDLASTYPAIVRIRTTGTGGRGAADLTLKLSQVEINVPLARGVFDVEVPRDATPLTLEELRRAGPLGEVRR